MRNKPIRTAPAMRELDLQEWEWSEPIPLSVDEREALRQVVPLDAIEPVRGLEGVYYLKPRSHVGAIEVGGLSVLIEPKIGIRQVLSLACYAIGQVKFQAEDSIFGKSTPCPMRWR